MRDVRFVALVVGGCILSSGASQAFAASVRDSVRFSTAGQALFGKKQGQAEATKVIRFGTTPVFRESRGPITRGEIFHLDQDLPVETAQAIWQKAVEACTTTRSVTQTISVSIPIVGAVSRSCRGSVKPSESQCVIGGTIQPRLTATCCVFGGTYPNCRNGLGADTISVSTNRLSFNVGSAVGPKPTTGTSRPYDVGFVATGEANVEVGIEGTLDLDAGSVDVEYPTTIELETSADDVQPGSSFTVTAHHTPGAVRLTTEYPNLSVALSTYTKVDSSLRIEYAGINYENGDQIRKTIDVETFNTADDPEADEQGRIVNEIIEVKAGLGAGLQVQVNTDVSVGGVEGMGLDPIGPFVLPIEFSFDITNPPKPAPFCDLVPRPECNFNPPVSTDIVEMLFRTPLLDTPAVPGFNGGSDFSGVAGSDRPIEQARNQLLVDGSIRNTTITGKRDALESSLEAVGGDLTKLSISDGVLDTDLVRLGVDIDGSLTGFGLPPGGADLQLPPQIPAGFFIPKLRGKHLLEVEANIIDLDAIDYLYFDQELIFTPNLTIELVFDKPARMRIVGSGEGFALPPQNGQGEYVAALPIHADVSAAIEVIQPAGGVTITPRYSIAANNFQNNLDWLINTGIQGTIGQIVLGGAIVAIAGPILTGVTDLESFNFALGQFSPSFDQPIRIPAHEAFALGGFGEPVSGEALSVGVRPDSPTPTPVERPTPVRTDRPDTSPTSVRTAGGMTPTPTYTRTPAAETIRLSASSGVGAPGDVVELSVWLTAGAVAVTEAAADLLLPGIFELLPVDCEINPAIATSLVISSFEATDATGYSFLVQATTVEEPIADGRLFTCLVRIADSAPEDRYEIHVRSPQAFDRAGNELDGTTQRDGQIRVSRDASSCSGDCNDDGVVRINEIILAVSVGLGLTPAVDCLVVDLDGNDAVTINEIITAVNNGLEGCPR